jgi:hypothetical protein
MLAALVNAPNLITNADANLTAATWNVVKATTAAHTVTLPAPAAGVLVGVRVTGDSTKLVTLSQHAADLIDGQAARVMWAGEKAVLLSDGTNWFKVAGLTIPMRCLMTLSAVQSGIASDTGTTINLDTASVDNTGLMADTTNHKITIQRAGVYAMVPLFRLNSTTASMNRMASSFWVNGGALQYKGIGECTTANGATYATVANPSLFSFSAGDYVQLNAFLHPSDGANQSAYGNGTTERPTATAPRRAVTCPLWSNPHGSAHRRDFGPVPPGTTRPRRDGPGERRRRRERAADHVLGRGGARLAADPAAARRGDGGPGDRLPPAAGPGGRPGAAVRPGRHGDGAAGDLPGRGADRRAGVRPAARCQSGMRDEG